MSASPISCVVPMPEKPLYSVNAGGILSPPAFNMPIGTGEIPCWYKPPPGEPERAPSDRLEEAVASYNCGVANWRAGKLEVAMDLFERALKQALSVNSNNAVALNDLGVIEQFRGNYEKADSYLRQALARASDKKEAAKYTFNRGVGAEGNLDYRGARDTYRHAIRLDPTNSGYHERLRSLLAVPGVRVSADMRHPVGSSEADADYRLGLGLTWRLWDFSEKFGIGPQGQFDVNVGGNKATVGGTAGLALIYQEPYGATPTAFVARMGAGGHGIHAATSSDAVDAPVRNGPVFNYSLDFLRPISHQWWVGLALTMEHEMENPGRYAFGPGILLTGMPW